MQTLGYPELLTTIFDTTTLLDQRCFMRPARWLLLSLQNWIASA
jgi:hypothetical protein